MKSESKWWIESKSSTNMVRDHGTVHNPLLKEQLLELAFKFSLLQNSTSSSRGRHFAFVMVESSKGLLSSNFLLPKADV
jgi:hypothetical protein